MNGIAKSICDFSFGMLFMSQVVCTVAMYAKGRHHSLQRVMFWFMAYLLGISVFEFCYFYLFAYSGSPLSAPLTDILEMTVVPCALFVIVRLTTPQKNQRAFIVSNLLFYLAGGIVAAATGITAVYVALLAVTVIYSVGIIAYGFFAVHKFNKKLKTDFSDNQLSLYWLKYIVYLYMAIMFIWTAATVYSSEYMVAIYNVSVLVLFGLFCYFVYRQDDMLEALNAMGDEEAAGTAVARTYDFEVDFKKAFEEDCIFLNPKLNIVELSQAVGTNRTYISNYINQHLHTTFYEYVNGWRVRRAKQLLRSTTLTLEEIAGKSGFNSLSSFRRYFTNATGQTPASYRGKGR